MNKKKEVIKHNSAIRIEGRNDLLGRKTWNILLANSFDDLLKKEVHEIDLKEIYSYLDYKSRNDVYLKESLRNLLDIRIEWDILDDNNKEIEWGIASLLSQMVIKKGVCYYSFAPAVKEILFNPKMYSKINLKMQNKFKNCYSLVLYELAKSYYIAKKGKGISPYIKLEDFKKIIGINKNEYPEFKIFNRAIIKPCLKAINKFTDIKIEIENKKTGRKITHLQLKITANSKNLIKPLELDFKKEEIDLDLEDRLKKIGFSKQDIKKLKKDYSENEIIDSLDLLNIEVSKKTIKSLKGWLISCLKQGFDMNILEEKRSIEKKQKENKKKEIEKETLKKDEEKKEIEKEGKIDDWISKNEVEYKKLCKTELNKIQKNNKWLYSRIEKQAEKEKKSRIKVFMENKVYFGSVKTVILDKLISL